MDRNNELKEIDIKSLTCNYFDDIINFDLDNILIDGIPYKIFWFMAFQIKL